MAAPSDGFEKKLEVFDKLIRDLIQIAVLFLIALLQKLLGQPQRGFVADHRCRSETDARQLPALFVVGTKDLHQRVTVRLRLAQIAVQYDLGRHLFLVELEVSLNSQNVGGNGVQVQVQILSAAAFFVGFSFCRVPGERLDEAFDRGVSAFSVDCQTHRRGSFASLVGLVPPNVKQPSECCLFHKYTE